MTVHASFGYEIKCGLQLLRNTFKIPLANVIRFLAERSET